MIRHINLPRFSSVAPGSQSILQLGINVTYDMIRLVYTNGTAADIEDIQIKANGKTFQRPYGGATGYDWLNKYYGRTVTAGQTEIWFQRPEMTSVEVERLTSFGTRNLQSATIEIKVRAAAAANFNVEAYAIVSPATPSGIITKIVNYPFNAGAGLNDLSTIVTGNQGVGVPVPTAIAAIHLWKNADDITSVAMNIDGVNFWDTTPVAELDSNAKAFGRVLEAKWNTLDFILDGNHLSAMMSANARDLRIQPACTTGGMVQAMVEYFDTLGGVL